MSNSETIRVSKDALALPSGPSGSTSQMIWIKHMEKPSYQIPRISAGNG